MMTDAFREQCVQAIKEFDSSFREMDLPLADHQYAYQLLEKVREDVSNPKLDGLAFCLAIRYFFDFFSRELMPGGIVLSEKASKDWNVIRELANSTELLRTTNSAISFGF